MGVKIKNICRRAGILLGVFIAALIVSSLITNRGTDARTVGISDPTLPRVFFMVEDQIVNILAGYTDEMDITAMRDTITPVANNGMVMMGLQRNGNDIVDICYEVRSLDGETVYLQNQVKDVSGTNVTLELNGGLPEEVSESVLRVEMEINGGENVYFYTRIEWQQDLWIKECLQYAKDFHDKALAKDGDTLDEYLEPNDESDNTTLQTVNIHSNLYHVEWGDMEPEAATSVEWSIKESNSVYTSLRADYQVTAKGDSGEIEAYNVKEFFRVRCTGEEMFLLNYNRTMNQVFDGNKSVLDENGILLGLADSDVAYETNKKGTVVSFVQERALWTYQVKNGELSQVFSFAAGEGRDARRRNDEHEVRIISMEDDGSTTFAVYGYMNCGEYEGKVGVNIFYFDIKENAVREIAFIPSTKSFAIAEDELGKMVYYNQQEHLLYVLAGGVLYCVDVGSGRQKELAEDLTEGQYVASADGHLLAYQTDGSLNEAAEVRVMNLATGESFDVKAPQESYIRPLGFIKEDFICGYGRMTDQGETVAGEEIIPMYELEIFDKNQKSLKKYSQAGIYISDILAEENLVAINRVIKTEGLYTSTEQDYITSNEERKEAAVTAETFATKIKETQVRLTFAETLKKTAPKLLYPKLVSIDDAVTIAFDDKIKTDRYYVYGVGELVAVYDKAAYAIQKAEQISGVVISSEQSYIWEKGNRDLEYMIEMEAFEKADDMTSFEACVDYMETYEAKRIDLTGCTLSQVLYIINKGMPVIAMTDSSHAILLIGYTTGTVIYMNPDDGSVSAVSMDEMDAMLAGSGNTFIGYCK